MQKKTKKIILTATLAAALAGITAIAAIAATTGQGPQASGNNLEENLAPGTGAAETGGTNAVEIPDWNLERGPISSDTEAKLAPSEIRGIAQEYLAVNLWANTAMTAAREQPQEFEKVMFSEISTDCAREQQERMELTPDPPVEAMLECARNRILAGNDRWVGITQEERAARATRAVGLLFWALDPPSLMSVMIAQQKGLDVNVRTNAEFARFAAMYDGCEDSLGGHADRLGIQESSGQLAGEWIRVDGELKECISQVNQEIFWPEETGTGE